MKKYTFDEMVTMCDKARQAFIHPKTKDIIISAGKKDMIFKFNRETNTYK